MANSIRQGNIPRVANTNQQGQDLNVNLTTFQLSFFLSNLGKLIRRPGLGKRKMMWYKSTDPDAYEMSQVFQLWARSWVHATATCKSGGLTKELCREWP